MPAAATELPSVAGNGVGSVPPPSGPRPEGRNMDAIARVFGAVQGHWLSACLRTLLELHIPDILAEAQKPMSVEELCKASGVAAAGTGHLYKVLRVLAQWDMLDELPGKQFAPNDATTMMVRKKGQPSLGHMAAHLVNAEKWEAWNQLPQAVKEGSIAFKRAHGCDVYQYGEMPEHPEFASEFCDAMTFFTRHSLQGGSRGLEAAYDWSSCRCIMDVGGGHGELLSRCLALASQDCKGVLLDREMVLKGIDIPGTFEAKGVKRAAERLTFVAADVRQPFPQQVKDAQPDALLMKHFLSAFSDEDSVAIVTHCRQVLAPQGRVLLLQTLVPEPGDKAHNTCEDGVAPGLFAIEILAQCPGGAWRTLSEWRAIFEKAGMQLDSAESVGCNMNLMIWKAAGGQ